MDSIGSLLVLSFSLGLLGFVEPCSIGSSLVFIRFVERNPARTRAAQATMFMITRALFLGMLGGLAAIVGAAFAAVQQFGWIILGCIYIALGLIYLTRNAGILMHALGPRVDRLSGMRGALALAVLFGLNVPACAAPLLAAMLGPAALLGGANIAQGFLLLAVFGLALSAPLVIALLVPGTRRLLDRFSAFARRMPVFLGLLLLALGVWSVYSGLLFAPRPQALTFQQVEGLVLADEAT